MRRIKAFPHGAAGGHTGLMECDPGEELFDRYLEANGYRVLAREPDLGTVKRPDRLVRAGGHEIVAEVKSFHPQVLADPDGARFDAQALTVTKVRNKISDAAAQLKGIEGYPLVVVLTNPTHAPLPLEPTLMVQALYGDYEVTTDDDGSPRWRSGRNGRLYVDGPDGSARGNHPYLSAVCVLQDLPTEAAATVAWMQQHAAQYPNPLAAYAEALRQVRVEDRGGHMVRLDVFETVSSLARQLPREVFAGRFDSRWGLVTPGYYGRL